MPNIAIVTDSTAYLSEEDKQTYTIHTVPLSISFGQETYREAVDIQTDVFYERMREEGNCRPVPSQLLGNLSHSMNRWQRPTIVLLAFIYPVKFRGLTNQLRVQVK